VNAPHRIASLWDMLELNLFSLVTSTNNLKQFSEALAQTRVRNQEFNPPGEPQLGFLKISAQIIADLSATLHMVVTAAMARKVVARMSALDAGPMPAGDYSAQALEEAIDDMMSAFRDECREREVVMIPPHLADLFAQPKPIFGDAVSIKFAQMATDISEAAKCLSLERPTACVFHLMRVAEHAVKRLGKRLQVAIDVEKENWYQVILHVNKAVDQLPSNTVSQRRTKQKLAGAAAHLNLVRIATRNDVMHPKATYTDEEAKEVYDATKALMQQMAGIL
jgi:hypothetical protein